MADADNNGPQRVIGRPFEKGVSPNPGGRHKLVREAVDTFRKLEDIERLRVRLLDLALTADPKVSVSAIKEYLDRGLGRPLQTHANEDGTPLFAAGAEFVEALQKLVDDGPKPG